MVRNSSTQHFHVGSPPSLLHDLFSYFDSWLLNRLYVSLGKPQVEVRLPDGPKVTPSGFSPVASVVIHNRATLLKMVLDPELEFGEGYTAGYVSVYGNLVVALERVFRALPSDGPISLYSRTLSHLLVFLQRNSPHGARKNINRHYDLDTSFFQLWLDAQLVYSGAYFTSHTRTLEQAQIDKMDYICRKINLQHGECVLDIGCGWGALAMHMAKYYGALVRAISNSHEQILWARHRAAQLGLADRIEFIEDDYRNLHCKCDALVSVGMLEHVGANHYRDMGEMLRRVLGPTGRGLIQTVGQNRACQLNLWMRKHVFPGTYAPSLRQAMDLFEPGEFSIVDVENLRTHYARTLECWLERFEKVSPFVDEKYGPEFVRRWRLYLAGCTAAFRAGSLQLFQILFAGSACRRLPFSRAQLYQRDSHQQEQDERRTCAVS
jgi:cyclopropane-fatty-acyl-phospholipid synthase